MSSRQSEMSGDDYSDVEIDIESHSPLPHDWQQGANPLGDHKRHARAQHNALERRRRDNIKEMYNELKDEIPNFNHDRASRAQILSLTIDEMKAANAEAEDAHLQAFATNRSKNNLIREISQVEAEIAALKAAIAAKASNSNSTPTSNVSKS
uniref:BHLH domain-containing protein n=1 Tax=Panagrellus redivivus TaxID=6233 RepID=A0A7E4W9D6_PANRE